MGKNINSRGLDHQLLVRLDENVIGKLKNHATKNDMSMSAIVRRSLRKFFENEEMKNRETG
ncbi:MAG: ribbon-helix-helix domain-containing protein [Bacteroidales bacterium]|jgi:predicted transcriptional regulator|nr:ribbon-helix-helix domain-containing protein [Bacteroidales bacterium]